MATTAAIVFVKDDVDDIGWWIAHHLAVGFDQLIVIDDHSTDGTWEVVQQAAAIFPVEVQRSQISDNATYAERRSDAYGLAIDFCRNRFDWVICLESDEYVCPESDPDIGTFLSRFDHADGIMLHWSIFGSNGHVTRPTEAPPAAYTRRAALDFADHNLGKSFIRPSIFNGQFIDGCHWTIAPENYLRANGDFFETDTPADWNGARILHYVTRNLTHYTNRLAQLTSSGQTVPDLWSHFNRNEIQDSESARFMEATRAYAARLGRAILDSLYWRMRQDIQENSLSFVPDTPLTVRSHQSVPSPRPLRFASLSTAADETLIYDSKTRRLAFSSSGTDEENQVFLVMEDTLARQENLRIQPNAFLLLPATAADASGPLGAFLTHWIPVHVDDTAAEAEGVALFLPASMQWLARDEHGALSLDGQTPQRLHPAPITPDRSVIARIQPYLALRSHGDTLHDFCAGLDMLRAPHADALACAIAHLPAPKRALLQSKYAGLVPPWLAHS